MKHINNLLGTAFVALSLSPAGAVETGQPIHLTAIEKDATSAIEASSASVTRLEEKSPLKAKLDREQELIFEDFNLVPNGETETIGDLGERYCDLLASCATDSYIDPSLTPSGAWEGNHVYAGNGGTIILQCYDPQAGAFINTPLGEYAGDITVRVRCRWAKSFWGWDNELGYVSVNGSTLICRAGIGGYQGSERPVTDMEYAQMESSRIYENDGWVELAFTFRNESANRDGYISLMTQHSIEIDWIKITDAATFLPEPVVDPVTNFKGDSFTINWQPVRRSFDYYIDLWKVDYKAEKGIDENVDFEDGKIPAGWSAGDAEIEDGIGMDGSQGIRLGQNGVGAALSSPEYPSTLGSVAFNALFEVNDPDAVNESGVMGTLVIEGLADGVWNHVIDVNCDNFITSAGYFYKFILDGEKFEGKYSALRFYPANFGDGNSLLLDNIIMWGERPYELVRAESPYNIIWDPENDDYPYNYYDATEHKALTAYTVKDLDPEAEYWYRVRSHNVSDFTIGKKHHAFGVASPQQLPATAVGGGSYTANWEKAPKAQGYVVRNYKATRLTEDEEKRSIFRETFSNCKGSDDPSEMTALDNTEGLLDTYTDMPGWTGKNNSVCNGMMGGSDNIKYSLISPILPLNPSRGSYYVYVEGYGYQGDTFEFKLLKSGLPGYLAIDNDYGYFSATFEVPEAVVGERIQFRSYNGLFFALDTFEVMQDVKDGDVVRIFQSEVEMPAEAESCVFTGLDAESLYAYQVLSKFTLEQKSTMSESPDMIVVDMSNGNSFLQAELDEVSAGATELSRHNAAGIAVGSDYKGVVIIRMSDGSVRKQINR